VLCERNYCSLRGSLCASAFGRSVWGNNTQLLLRCCQRLHVLPAPDVSSDTVAEGIQQ
jgi:hypothetical protein